MRFKPSHPDSKLERRCKCTGGSLLDTAGIRFNLLFSIYQGFGRTIDRASTDNPNPSEDSQGLHFDSQQLHDLTVDTEELRLHEVEGDLRRKKCSTVTAREKL
jgi:hypothetical protein